MGFNYSWFKTGATTLPNTPVFNRYFKKGEAAKADDNFIGLELTKKLNDYFRGNLGGNPFLKQKERYYAVGSITGNLLAIMAIFFPPLLGGTGALMCALFFIASVFSEGIDPPWLLLCIVIAWNLFWLNVSFVTYFIFSKFKGAYIDRQKQTMSFTWKVKGNPEKNEFGHATFPLSDIEAFYSLQTKNQQGGSTHALCLAHKDHDTYGGAFLQSYVNDNPNNPNFCQLEWELIQRFADNTLPLPDMPDLEKYRQLDPATVEYDKKHKRPEFHWRIMHEDQQYEIQKQTEEQAYSFPFNSALNKPKRYANKELVTPWLTWPIEQQYFADELAVPLWKKRAKLIFSHLTIGG